MDIPCCEWFKVVVGEGKGRGRIGGGVANGQLKLKTKAEIIQNYEQTFLLLICIVAFVFNLC